MKRKARSETVAPLVTEVDPKSPAAEAYRSLRTNVQFARLDQPLHSIVVTSASAGEGKTTTVANFGAVMAQGGLRVCLIDSDLRRPSLHKLFGCDNSRGVSTALLNGGSFAEVAQPTRVPNLAVVPSGPLPPNPAELIGSPRMQELSNEAVSRFDLIVFDSPPIVSVSDAAMLAARADGVVFVVRVGGVPYEVVRRGVEQIEVVNGRVLGIVLNRVNLRRDGYFYDYYRYANSYYNGYVGHRSGEEARG